MKVEVPVLPHLPECREESIMMQAVGFLIKSVLIIKQAVFYSDERVFQCYGHMSVTQGQPLALQVLQGTTPKTEPLQLLTKQRST